MHNYRFYFRFSVDIEAENFEDALAEFDTYNIKPKHNDVQFDFVDVTAEDEDGDEYDCD